MQFAGMWTLRAMVAGAALALSAMVAQAQDALAVVQGYVGAWNAHDSAKAAEFFTDDVSYFDASVGEAIKGREAAKVGVIDNFLTAVPDAKWSILGDPIVSGDHVAFEWTFSGTNTGPWGDGTAATNKSFVLNGMTMITVKDGKIATQSDYYDALGFYNQLGLM